MTDKRNRPGDDSGAAPKQAGETLSRESTGPAVNLAAWHEQAEWENAHQYAEGYAAGYAAAEQAIGQEIALAVGVKPYDRRDVIRWLIRTIGQPTTRRPEPYSSQENGTTLGVVERDVIGRWAA